MLYFIPILPVFHISGDFMETLTALQINVRTISVLNCIFSVHITQFGVSRLRTAPKPFACMGFRPNEYSCFFSFYINVHSGRTPYNILWSVLISRHRKLSLIQLFQQSLHFSGAFRAAEAEDTPQRHILHHSHGHLFGDSFLRGV